MKCEKKVGRISYTYFCKVWPSLCTFRETHIFRTAWRRGSPYRNSTKSVKRSGKYGNKFLCVLNQDCHLANFHETRYS